MDVLTSITKLLSSMCGAPCVVFCSSLPHYQQHNQALTTCSNSNMSTKRVVVHVCVCLCMYASVYILVD